MNVAFINENTLGHTSYLPPFVNEFRKRPDFGVTPHVIHASPLSPRYARWGDFSVRGLRKWGLDFHNARWRLAVSKFAREQLLELMRQHTVDAVVVNTQSVGLDLVGLPEKLSLFVCLDATFRQLEQSRWFAPNLGTRWFLPVTASPLRARERRLFERAHRLVAWSEPVRQSLVEDYGCAPSRVCVLPPSVSPPASSGGRKANARPQILFLGGDFRRKGGPLLLETYRRRFAAACDLHIVTQSDVSAEPGVHVHRNITPYSEAWVERWRQADVFVFPSTLETFGIVLLEALAFQVPVISSKVGAAADILADGRAGWLLADRRPETLAAALREVLNDRAGARLRACEGLKQVEERFDLSRNTQRLASWLHQAVAGRQVAWATASPTGVSI